MHRYPRAQVRAEQTTRNGADQKVANQVEIDVSQSPMQQAGHAGERDRVNDVGSDHNLGWETVEQKQQHHDDAP